MELDLFDAGFNAVVQTREYGEFKRLLSSHDCRRCTLAQARSRIVVDRGNPAAPILVVGERPGAQEDADPEGRAFVGRAGELLDRILASIGLSADRDTLITNVARCIPPEDRAPTAAEARACLPYLQHQIRLVKPKVILLLGAVALRHLSRGTADPAMEEQAGRFFDLPEYPGIKFMVLYHPAFLLRDPSKKRDMWEHMKTLKTWLVEQGIYPRVAGVSGATF